VTSPEFLVQPRERTDSEPDRAPIGYGVTRGVDYAGAVFIGAATYLASWEGLSRAELRVDLSILRSLARSASEGISPTASTAED